MGEGTVETSETTERERKASAPVPGALLVFTGGKPTCIASRLPDGQPFTMGRGGFGGALDDAKTSRAHVRITRRVARFVVEDAGSRNGTTLDGVRLQAPREVGAGAVVRIGQSLVLVVDDALPFERPRPFEREGAVVGPALDRAYAIITRAAAAGETVLLRGETGSGKELAARVFHESAGRGGGAGRAGPFVAVNCAAIPLGVAERLLFGAKRGAYSGADADAEGYFQAADRGTLFLDEIAELDLLVQAKLLRAIEAQEVIAVGAARPRKIDVRVCCASHKDLRAEVAVGRFRQDLYFRIGRPEVLIPPLRERREEIPWLVHAALRELGLAPHASLIEACLLRDWPGNVRELLAEVRHAGHDGGAREADREVRASDLDARAGLAIVGHARPQDEPLVVRERAPMPDEARIRRALEEHDGNVTGAARALGVHRNQLRRWIERRKISAGGREKP
jgi:transcriptional regulator with GAF, ATPase, and Fis domain